MRTCAKAREMGRKKSTSVEMEYFFISLEADHDLRGSAKLFYGDDCACGKIFLFSKAIATSNGIIENLEIKQGERRLGPN